MVRYYRSSEAEGRMTLGLRLHRLFILLDGAGVGGLATGNFPLTVQVRLELLFSLLREVAPKLKDDEYRELVDKLRRVEQLVFSWPEKSITRKAAALKMQQLKFAYDTLHDVEVALRKAVDKHGLYDFKFEYKREDFE